MLRRLRLSGLEFWILLFVYALEFVFDPAVPSMKRYFFTFARFKELLGADLEDKVSI